MGWTDLRSLKYAHPIANLCIRVGVMAIPQNRQGKVQVVVALFSIEAAPA